MSSWTNHRLETFNLDVNRVCSYARKANKLISISMCCMVTFALIASAGEEVVIGLSASSCIHRDDLEGVACPITMPPGGQFVAHEHTQSSITPSHIRYRAGLAVLSFPSQPPKIRLVRRQKCWVKAPSSSGTVFSREIISRDEGRLRSWSGK